MIRRAALLCLVLVASRAPLAEAQVKLEYKYPEGSHATYKTTTRAHQVLTIAGMDVETDSTEVVTTGHAVGKRNADGTLPLTQTIEGLTARIALPGGINIDFDSAKPDVKIENPAVAFLGDVFKALIGVSFTVVLDDKGQVKFVEGTEKNLAKLDALDPKAAAVLKSRLGSDHIKQAYEIRQAMLPAILVREGEPWERTEVTDIGSGQSLTFKKRYEYKGTVEKDGRKFAKIEVKALEVSYAMDPAAESPLKAGKSDLKIDSSEGTILFDAAAGSVIETRGVNRIKGDILFTANGMELPSKLDLTLDSATVREPSETK